MGICLCHIKTILCNQIFFTDFVLVCTEGDKIQNLPCKWTPQFMVKIMVQVAALYCIVFVSYSHFCKRM